MAESGEHVECVAAGWCAAGTQLSTVGPVQAAWRKSSWSTSNGNCMEVAEPRGRLIGLRDTKDAGLGPVLVFGDAEWRSFISEVKGG